MQNALKEKPLRIRKILNQEEVRWGAVVDLLCSRYRIPFAAADLTRRHFMKRVDLPFNASWFLRKRLSPQETKLILSLCEVHGADTLVLTLEKTIKAGSIKIEYAQRVLLEPQLGRGRDTPPASSAEIDIKVLGKELRIRSLTQVVATQIILLTVAVLTYVIFVGAFLKGFATFLALTQDPAGVTMAATRRFDLMLGLLLFLVGAAGIFGQAIRNTANLAWRKISPFKPASIGPVSHERH